MTINSLKELERLVKACRRLGVDSITVDGIELKLGAKPAASASSKRKPQSLVNMPTVPVFGQDGLADAQIPTDMLTNEQMLFYSVTEGEQQ